MSGIADNVKDALGVGALSYLSIAVVDALGPQTFAGAATDRRTLVAAGLVAAGRLAYDVYGRDFVFRTKDKLYHLTGW